MTERDIVAAILRLLKKTPGCLRVEGTRRDVRAGAHPGYHCLHRRALRGLRGQDAHGQTDESCKNRAAARLRGTPVLLPADIGAAFSSTLRQMRLREGRTTAAAEVHHIVPLADSGTHAWDNLRALCKRCHSRITATEGGRWRK